VGIFNDVEVPDELLPEEARGLTGWQTKDCDPRLAQLVITPEGELYEEWWESEHIEDPAAWLGYRVKYTVKHLDKLYYHGDMRFYTGNGIDPNKDEWELIICLARFDCGKLRHIVFVGSEGKGYDETK
jgi:hypothetical protein